jgi:hypothetical protein
LRLAGVTMGYSTCKMLAARSTPAGADTDDNEQATVMRCQRPIGNFS